MKLAFVDKLGLCYDGTTLTKQGLGGSESAVILLAKELADIGFDVTVFNNCKDGSNSAPGIYDSVRYIDNTDAPTHAETYDVVIVSRSAIPFLDSEAYPFVETATKRVLWLHDTFVEGDGLVEDLVVSGVINHIFTLSDWHTSYITTCDHGKKRNYEVLKKAIFQTRNGAVCHIPEVDLAKKDRNHFVYNASATKGMVPLLDDIWPRIKTIVPDARLTVIGGFYRFRENAAPDAQEETVRAYAARTDLEDVTFTGVISQLDVAHILADASLMLYPGAFPETFGISSLESLLYKTPLVTTRFGALEETAVDQACYLVDYAIEPNNLFPTIDKTCQVAAFIEKFKEAYFNPYLLQQKQNYCDVVKDIAGWDTVALQWKQFIYDIMGEFLSVDEFRKVSRINDKVARIFGRTNQLPARAEYQDYSRTERAIHVVSPVRNAEAYIRDHILSVAQQDYHNYFHHIVDDASTDATYEVASATIAELPAELQRKFRLTKNETRVGCIANQLKTIATRVQTGGAIVMLLDGDDWLVNNNTIFKYYNDLYEQGYEFTYGSMWSLADQIPLIAQDYPRAVKDTGTYREHHFNWKIPYTHLRTCLSDHFRHLYSGQFKDDAGNWMLSGADNPLFYALIEQVDPSKIYCNKEIVCIYNDANPLNDYKVNPTEQNENANKSYVKDKAPVKRILLAIPTAKYIEVETFKSIYDLDVPDGYELDFQYCFGYDVSQVRNKIVDWAKHYDYLFSVDSDIVLPKDCLAKMLAADKDIISGLYIQRIPDTHTLEVYMDTPTGGMTNIPYELLPDHVVEIAGCGFGCVLVNSNVLRAMSYPHFFYTHALDHKDTISEDVYFCRKAREAGFTIWADPSITCDHIGAGTFRVKPKLEKVAYQDLLPEEHVNYLANMSAQPKVIYDIGACVLHWTRHAQAKWPTANFVLLDAAESVEPFLKRSGHPYAIAVLSDETGKEVTFYEDPNNPGGNSYYKEVTGAYTDEHKRVATTVTLDDLIAQNSWPLPELIKIDAQGAELDILRGATNSLVNCTDIILEAQHIDYNEGAPKIDEVREELERMGFELVASFSKGNVDGDYHFRRRT